MRSCATAKKRNGQRGLLLIVDGRILIDTSRRKKNLPFLGVGETRPVTLIEHVGFCRHPAAQLRLIPGFWSSNFGRFMNVAHFIAGTRFALYLGEEVTHGDKF
jgi:hypothetical protein